MKTELLLPVLGELFAKGAAILLVAALIVRMWRGASAAQRHFVWFAAVAVLLLLPLSRLLNPIWGVPIERPVVASAPAARVTLSMAEFAPAPVAPAVAPAPKAQPAVWMRLDWRVVLLVTWLAGVAVCLVYRFAGCWRLHRLEKRSAPLEEEHVLAMSGAILRELGIERPVALRVSDECRVPMTWGLRRATLVLPRAALGWNETRLATALRHEAGHILRRDYLVRWIAQFACAIHWPNPLVWVAARSLRLAQEQATDDLVLRAGTSPEEYAAQLFDAARTVAAHGLFARQAVSMASPSTLESRVLAIVDERRDRRPLSRLAISAGSLAIGLTLAVCAAAQLQGADPAPPAGATTPAKKAAAKGPLQVEIESKFVELTGDLGEILKLFPKEQMIFTDPQFQVVIRALNQTKGVDLLSAPRVTTQSKQKATIEIIREVRYATDWKKDGKAAWQPVDFANKNAGVTVNVTPEIKADGSIDLQLKTSVVELLGFTDLDAPGKQVGDKTEGKRLKPNFSERNLEKTAVLKDGETVAFDYGNETIRSGKRALTRRLLVFVSARIIDPNPPGTKDAAAKSTLQERIHEIIIPKLEFREQTLPECIDILRKEIAGQSEEGKGVNFIVKEGVNSDARMTLSLTNIPLAEALKYVTELANVKFKVEPYAVTIVSRDEPETLMTKEWKIVPDLIPRRPSGEREPAKDWLIAQGVVFTEGASAIYLDPTSRLVVRNTEEQMDLIDALIEASAKGSEPGKKEATAPEPPGLAATEQIRSRLNGTIIPKLELREMPVAEVVDLLNKRARELDPEGKGVEIVLKPGTAADVRITLSLSNVPLMEALRYVNSLGGLQAVIEPTRVVLEPAGPGAASFPKTGAGTLQKVGTGTLLLGETTITSGGVLVPGGAYTGATIVTGGTLNIANPTEGPAASGTINSLNTGGVLNVAGSGELSVSGNVTPAMPAIDLSADSTRMENGITIVKGKAVLSCAGTTINSDEMTYDAQRRRAECRGNVVIKQGANTITADQLNVEFDGAGKMRIEGDKMKVNTAGEPAAPYGVWVAGKPGYVVSPHAALSGYVDVRGFKAEAEVKCPFTGKTFRVPPPQDGPQSAPPAPPKSDFTQPPPQ